jgi:hypothetical protein
MRHQKPSHLFIFIISVSTLLILGLLSLKVQALRAGQGQGASVLPSQQGNPDSTTLQRGSPPSRASNSRSAECKRREADWERNLPWRSAFSGLVFYCLYLYGLTAFRLSNTIIRLACSVVASSFTAPVIVGFQKVIALKICESPPGLFGVLTADLFMWTLFGITLPIGVFTLIRFISVVKLSFSKDGGI